MLGREYFGVLWAGWFVADFHWAAGLVTAPDVAALAGPPVERPFVARVAIGDVRRVGTYNQRGGFDAIDQICPLLLRLAPESATRVETYETLGNLTNRSRCAPLFRLKKFVIFRHF